jgi:hypothetical protein
MEEPLKYMRFKFSARWMMVWLVLAMPVHAAEIFNYGSTWRYFLGVREASTPDRAAWRAPGFDDSTWPGGPAAFGYANPPNSPAEENLATVFPSSAEGNYLSVFFRKTFVIPNVSAVSELRLDLTVDDGFVAWINGQEVGRANVPDGDLAFNATASTAGEPTQTTITLTNSLEKLLLAGANVLAVQVFNGNSGSSDLVMDAALSSDTDLTPPAVVQVNPGPNSVVNELKQIEVFFDASVRGVEPADLLINGQAATNVTEFSPRDYLFTFPQPAQGTVQVGWAAGHGITDLAGNPGGFGGEVWTYSLDLTPLTNTVIISEFMADNDHGIKDEDADREDWIEILNLGPLAVNLEGWFLTHTSTNLTQWRFPAVTLGVGQYLLVWASAKNRADPLLPLHTNFKVEKSGGYLALVDAQTNVVSTFLPGYPPQRADLSYGRDRANPSVTGFYYTPTPGAANATSGPGFAPTPEVSLESGAYTNSTLSVTLSAPFGEIRYTLDGSVPTGSSPVYTSPLAITVNTVVKARVFQAGLLPGAVVARTYILLDSTAANFTSNLPVMILTTGGKSIAQDVAPGRARTAAGILTFEPFRGRTGLRDQLDFDGLCELEIRGQSSVGFAKKAYNLEIQDEYRQDRSVPLLGLPSESDWVLYNPYSDKPFLQNFLAYELHEKMGYYAVRRRFVEVFLNTARGRLAYPRDYGGIYLLVEKIKIANNRVDLHKLGPEDQTEPDVTGGYIIKKDKDSVGDVGFSTTGGGGFGGQALKLHDPKPTEFTNAVQDARFIWIRNYLNQFEKALYATDWLKATGANHYSWYIDVGSFVDNHWIVEFSKQIDGYRLSNYMSKDRGGKLKMAPIWDWNLSFGNADYLEGWRTNGWYYTQLDQVAHIWLRRLINGTTASTGKTGDPDFNQLIIDRWSELRTNVFSASNIVARVDELAAMLDEAAKRDFAKYPRLGTYVWPNPSFYVTPRTYQGIIDALKTWIQGRYAWIDTQFPRAPAFSLSGGRVPPGFRLGITAPGATIYYTLDGTDPRARGGTVAPGAKLYAGLVPIDATARVFARAWRTNTWSGPTATTFVVDTPRFVLTELMYHPARPPTGSTNVSADFEFLEFANLGATALALGGYRLTGDVEFTFPNLVLGIGQRVLVVKNRAAFISRYGADYLIAGEYTGNLSNAGRRLRLEGRLGERILGLVADDRWHPISDGAGFSLVVADEGAPLGAWGQPSQWRPSREAGGSPGRSDPPPPPAFPRVVISEALTHTDPPVLDAIELQNLSATEADIGGWFLTDDFTTPKKYRIAPGTKLRAGEFRVFTEADFNTPGNALSPFALSSQGDQVYLFSGDAQTNLTGYVHGFEFAAQRTGVTFGRRLTSTGEERFVAQSAGTLGEANAGPLVSPVVISEIMYRPPDVFTNAAYWNNSEDEYLELFNRSDAPVTLADPNYPTNTWKLDKAVEFTFPTNTTLAPGGYLLVVNFNPTRQPALLAAFVAKYNVPEGVSILGPYRGDLANGDERVALYLPDAPATVGADAGRVPYVLVEEIHYSDKAPWPVAADGMGLALSRRSPDQFGDDPANWDAAAPTPGRGYTPGTPPTLEGQPPDQAVSARGTATFSVAAGGPGPLRYQWQFNGKNLLGATNATLVLTNVQPAQAGSYQVTVLNPAAAVTSRPAWLAVRVDADGDGMDDGWEAAHDLNPNLGSDATADPDADGQNNLQEYLSGTDPLDPRSQLRLTGMASTGSVELRFTALSNTTYTVQFTDSLNPPQWKELQDVPAQATTVTVVVVDPAARTERYYRLVTPMVP